MTVPALKEWAVIVRALLEGEQLLDVRKGGLREEERHFGLQATRFWLYPTVEHQRVELVKPAYRRWVDESVAAAPDDGELRIDGWADVVGVATVTDPDVLTELDSKLIWTLDYAESRLKWKRRDPLWVLALRAYRLVEPITVAWQDRYAGCASWVMLDGMPDDPSAVDSEPALTDESFAARLRLVEPVLPNGFEAPVADQPAAEPRPTRAGR
jgi:hypothetical protein